jgi:hypothetical protein
MATLLPQARPEKASPLSRHLDRRFSCHRRPHRQLPPRRNRARLCLERIGGHGALIIALVRSSEYEVWPRGRIVFDRARDLFILYADRKLLPPAMIARIKTQFHLPENRTEIQSDLHYQSAETPNALATRPTQS